MNRYFVELAYDGTAYHGWQVQPNASTVQEVLEGSLQLLLRENLPVVGAGRTDTGVHASYYVAHFETEQAIHDLSQMVYKLNRILPADIVIFNVTQVDSHTHSRFSAISRTYEYRVVLEKSPFHNKYTWCLSFRPDFERMNHAGELLTRYSDFTSFSKLHTDVRTNVCKIEFARWERRGNEWVFTIKADRFLRNMVRAIVGTMIEVGKGKLSLNDFCQIIEAKDRSVAGMSVPPQGLFLTDIDYPTDLFLSDMKRQKKSASF